jgi:hypothetical protein
LQAIYAKGADPVNGLNGGGFKGGLELMLEQVFESPAFLYREELGEKDPALSAGVVRLTDYEAASELSFLLTGSTPDTVLFAAAQNGQLKTPADYFREGKRLLMSPGAKPTLRAFMNEWMATTQVPSVSKDTTIYPNWTPALGNSMVSELGLFFDQVLWSGSGSLRELFMSTQTFVDGPLAQIYGVSPPTGNSMQMVSLDARNRRGIMTRVGWLTAHSDNDSSGPVPRGVFILQSLLCAPPPTPPANVNTVPPKPSETAASKQTTRQAFESVHINSIPLCVSCHTVIDGIGYGFEEFDGVGAYRATENGLPIDASGNLVGSDVDGVFNGASELSQKLLGSKQVLACFNKQVYRYAMGQVESAAAAATLSDMGTSFTADSHVSDAFLALLAEPAFVLRTTMNP